jgi:hypothetical protein
MSRRAPEEEAWRPPSEHARDTTLCREDDGERKECRAAPSPLLFA